MRSIVVPESNIDRPVSIIEIAQRAILSFAAVFSVVGRCVKLSSIDVVRNFIERAPPRTLIASPCFSKYSTSRRKVMLDTSGKAFSSSRSANKRFCLQKFSNCCPS